MLSLAKVIAQLVQLVLFLPRRARRLPPSPSWLLIPWLLPVLLLQSVLRSTSLLLPRHLLLLQILVLVLVLVLALAELVHALLLLLVRVHPVLNVAVHSMTSMHRTTPNCLLRRVMLLTLSRRARIGGKVNAMVVVVSSLATMSRCVEIC